jgi:hypothetical protein
MNLRTRSIRRGTTGGGRGAPASLLMLASAVYALVRFASWAESGPTSPKKATEARPEETPPAEHEASDPSPRPDRADAHEETERYADARPRGRRLASSLVFAALFFAGAALSAAAGDMIASPGTGGPTETMACGDAAATPVQDEAAEEIPGEVCELGKTETETGETQPAEGEDPEQGPEEETPDSEDGAGPPPADETEVPDGGPATPGDSPSGATKDGPAKDVPVKEEPPLLDIPRAAAPTSLDPEARGEDATVWLHRIFPDPTPPARRLAPAFARQLRATAARHRISWSLLLAVTRAQGNTGRVPVGPRALDSTAARLAAARDALGTYRPWYVALRYAGRTTFADRALALDRYNRAVGLRALVSGLAAAKPRLARRVLADERIAIYAAGRADVAAGRTDVRVLVLLRYLRIAHGSVTVSSLTSGHRLYARPGVVSAHVYGLAVDIAALGGRSIAGNQKPGGLTERAVRNVLLLPAELAPRQVISLLGLGGASFPLADHADHIHVGY